MNKWLRHHQSSADFHANTDGYCARTKQSSSKRIHPLNKRFSDIILSNTKAGSMIDMQLNMTSWVLENVLKRGKSVQSRMLMDSNGEPRRYRTLSLSSKRRYSKEGGSSTESLKCKKCFHHDSLRLEDVLSSKDGVEAFRRFLKSEYNEELLNMWLACEKYTRQPEAKLEKESQKIYDTYLEIDAPHEVFPINEELKEEVKRSLSEPTSTTFLDIQEDIFDRMANDLFQRFRCSRFAYSCR